MYGKTDSCDAFLWHDRNLFTDRRTFSGVIRSKIGSSGKSFVWGIDPHIQKDTKSDQMGEILVQGPSIIDHYLNQVSPDSWTEDGWFRTGDWGYLDDEDYLFIVSRMSERIISGERTFFLLKLSEYY